jgi:hypothetical protein
MSVISLLIRYLETWNRIKTSKVGAFGTTFGRLYLPNYTRETIVASLYRSVVYFVIYVGHAANIRL